MRMVVGVFVVVLGWMCIRVMLWLIISGVCMVWFLGLLLVLFGLFFSWWMFVIMLFLIVVMLCVCRLVVYVDRVVVCSDGLLLLCRYRLFGIILLLLGVVVLVSLV